MQRNSLSETTSSNRYRNEIGFYCLNRPKKLSFPLSCTIRLFRGALGREASLQASKIILGFPGLRCETLGIYYTEPMFCSACVTAKQVERKYVRLKLQIKEYFKKED